MATHQEYDGKTAGSNVAAEFSNRIKGKVVVITGVSPKSIGSALAENIAKQKPSHLILASRTPSNLSTVASKLHSSCSGFNLTTISLDLSSQKSVRAAVEEISGLVDHIDILINNAAVAGSKAQYNEDGIELMFAVGHVGHFLFTTLLMPLFEAASTKSETKGATRIVNVSSKGHVCGPVRFSDYNFTGKEVPDDEKPNGPWELNESNKFSPWPSYGQVKTANILFSAGLQKRFEDQGIRSYAAHPGSIQTDISRSLTPEDYSFLETLVESSPENAWISTDQGTSCILVAAFDPALDSRQSSVYLVDCQITDAAPWATKPEFADRLWELSERLTALKS